jgi:hypothetical protein
MQNADDRLKDAFRALAETSGESCSEEEIDRVWLAVSCEMPPQARRELVDRMATEPATAEAWRVAHELRQAQGYAAAPLEAIRTRSWTPTWIGLAAALVLTIGVGLLQLNRTPADVFRTQTDYIVESAVPAEAALSRDALVLRWTPGPDGSRYQARVMTEDLRILVTAADLTSPELRILPEQVSSLGPGSRVLWQVVATLPTGETVSSSTFVVRVQ